MDPHRLRVLCVRRIYLLYFLCHLQDGGSTFLQVCFISVLLYIFIFLIHFLFSEGCCEMMWVWGGEGLEGWFQAVDVLYVGPPHQAKWRPRQKFERTLVEKRSPAAGHASCRE